MDHNSHDPPPTYTSSLVDFQADEKTQPPVWLPHAEVPGFALASALSRGLQVPSRSDACSSGFDYPEELASHGITATHWAQFTQTICDEAKLSRQQWKIVIGKGLGTLAVGGLMFGFFGAIPALFIARHARRRQEQRNLVAAMAGMDSRRLARHIASWNETFFQSRGVLIRVDLPDEFLDEMDEMDVGTSRPPICGDQRAREKAALKARVVIIPLKEEISLACSESTGRVDGGFRVN
ncbi:hypothetical protein N7474_002270 [Penicillium riverlandense]|uniref:uncharacterized protein n=1 Tax=Penicillium riverlandense TaxID=1903569 RepID=UPI0025496ED2|nr:uncharacterized protein N7474_002270 [Penicillium riverlandense]KAJ5833959.1 hypothetical protein N7474_002270 [Penicillium riverlandense]